MSVRARRILAAVFALGTLPALLWLAHTRLLASAGESTPYTLWLRADGPPGRDDWVRFDLSHPLVGTVNVIKQVRCVPGDRLEADGVSVRCAGATLGVLKTRTRDGRPLTPFRWDGPVPEGSLWVQNGHPDSFDSRYYGFVETSRVTRWRPLW